MRKLLFILTFYPLIANAQLEVGIGIGLYPTSLIEPNGYPSPVPSSYKDISAPNIGAHLELSYILHHLQVGISTDAYQVSTRRIYSDRTEKLITYNTLFVPKILLNYLFRAGRFDIYAGICGGYPFATEHNSGYSLGGNIGTNYHFDKRMAFFINAGIDYLHIENHT